MRTRTLFPYKSIGLTALFSLLCLLLVACGGGAKSGPVELPLAEGKPTFLFFWTDN